MYKKVKKIRVDDLNEELKEELWIDSDVKDFRKLVANSPDLKEKVASLENVPEPDVEVDTSAGRPSMPKEVLDRRNEYIVGLYMLGVSMEAIWKNTNHKASDGGWLPISRDRVRKVVSDHFRKPTMTVLEEKREDVAMREWMFQVMHEIIHKVMSYARNRKDSEWKPFEYITTYEKIFAMFQQMVENRNWNSSKANPMISINSNMNNLTIEGDMHVSTFQRGSAMMHLKKSEGYQKLMEKLNEKLSGGSEEGEVIDAEVLEPSEPANEDVNWHE